MVAQGPPEAAREVPARRTLVDAFRTQSRGCAQSGSAIYEDLLARMAGDLEAGGIFADVVSDYRGHPMLDALPLRLLARVHAWVLEGSAPALARFYPSAGGRFDSEAAWHALLDLARERCDVLRDAAVHWRVQTNEVSRSAVLLPGFLRIAARTKLPLRVHEIGASAGLNQSFDRYRYELGPHRYGDPASPLVLRSAWEGPAPDLDAPLRVAERRGCDVSPIDLRDAAARTRLQSFIWPEQPERLARLRAAMEVALAQPPPAIETAPAGEWVERCVAPVPGATTVLFHSVVWWYVPEAERAQVTRAMDAAAARADAHAPLAWLRMEGAKVEEAELRLRIWPGGDDAFLATAHWHGAWVRWQG